MKIKVGLISTAALIGFCAIGCTKNDSTKTQLDPDLVSSGQQAISKVQLETKFKKVSDGVDAELKVTGLVPNTQHGLHIHEKGECAPLDFSSAGGHFNPKGHNHGAPGEQSHFGDLGNITADASGSFSGSIKIKNASSEGDYSILNRSLIVHEKTDDLKSQPSGDSGDRIACSVITTIE